MKILNTENLVREKKNKKKLGKRQRATKAI